MKNISKYMGKYVGIIDSPHVPRDKSTDVFLLVSFFPILEVYTHKSGGAKES